MDIDRSQARPRGCFNCGKIGHLAQACPEPRHPRTNIRNISAPEVDELVKERDELREELEELRALKEGNGKSAQRAQDFAKGPE